MGSHDRQRAVAVLPSSEHVLPVLSVSTELLARLRRRHTSINAWTRSGLRLDGRTLGTSSLPTLQLDSVYRLTSDSLPAVVSLAAVRTYRKCPTLAHSCIYVFRIINGQCSDLALLWRHVTLWRLCSV